MDLERACREELVEIIGGLLARLEGLEARLAELEAENLRLRRGGGSQTELSIKPSRPPKEKKERKHRAQAFVRRREKADEVRYHHLERCPDCGAKLTGEGWEHRRHQVIELELRRRVVDHVVLARRCGVCGKRALPNQPEADKAGRQRDRGGGQATFRGQHSELGDGAECRGSAPDPDDPADAAGDGRPSSQQRVGGEAARRS